MVYSGVYYELYWSFAYNAETSKFVTFTRVSELFVMSLAANLSIFILNLSNCDENGKKEIAVF